jgi:hypothetical protein
MTANEVIKSVRDQIITLRRAGLKPTMIVVGEDTFVSFVKSVDDIHVARDAMGIYHPPTIIGVRNFRTFEDQPITVLTNGDRDR